VKIISLKQTKSSPKVLLDAERGVIEFEGRSIMEDARDFYEPLIEWLGEYVETPRNTSVRIDLEYFNTTTNKFLQAFFNILASIRTKGFSVVVYWLYDQNDEDIWESGQEFYNRAEIDFIFIERTNSPIETIEIKESEISPMIRLEPVNGTIEIAGKSILPDPKSFYTPLIEWLSKYIKEPKDTLVSINLEKINTTTNRFLQLFFTMLSEIKLEGFKVQVNWLYNKSDEDNWESGRDYSSFSGLEFNFIERTIL
jgi:hypothetical protein